MPVLDSSFLIDLEDEEGAARQVLDRLRTQEERLIVPVQTAIEVAAGDAQPLRTLRWLTDSFHIEPLEVEDAVEAARIARAAFTAGTFPGWPDVQIAATATRLGMYVVTRNPRHFRALGARVWAYGEESDPPRS